MLFYAHQQQLSTNVVSVYHDRHILHYQVHTQYSVDGPPPREGEKSCPPIETLGRKQPLPFTARDPNPPYNLAMEGATLFMATQISLTGVLSRVATQHVRNSVCILLHSSLHASAPVRVQTQNLTKTSDLTLHSIGHSKKPSQLPAQETRSNGHAGSSCEASERLA